MFSKLLRGLGLTTADDIIGFFVCGLAVLPAMLFVAGERNAAAVVMLLLVNGLLVFGMRSREIEDREADAESMKADELRKAVQAPPAVDRRRHPR